MQVLLKKKTDRNSVNEIIMLVLSSILLASNINQPSLVDIRICRLGGKIFHILMNNGKVKYRGRWRRFLLSELWFFIHMRSFSTLRVYRNFDIRLKCVVNNLYGWPYEFMPIKKPWIELSKHLYLCKEGTRDLRLKFRVIR